ncbi:Non-catalytic module family DOC2, partial [Piromyces sp. E2]
MRVYLLLFSAILVNNVLCTKSKGNGLTGRYLELDNASNKAYMFSNKECTEIYLCKTHKDGGFFPATWNILKDCYYKNKLINEDFSKIYNPDDCDAKGYININSDKCYFSSSGIDISHNTKIEVLRTRYYDIDYKNNLALTEWGWCNFTFNDNDSKWMSKLDSNLKLNQVIIPGTHDSGTYAIHENVSWIDIFNIQKAARELWFRTQNLDITEQLQNGIRYLDIRIETNKDKQIYLSHEFADCYNRKTKDKYYLKDVFDEVVNFLRDNTEETIILHLKQEHIRDYYEDRLEELAYDIAKLSYFNNDYEGFFYNNTFNIYKNKGKEIVKPLIPTISETYSRIGIYVNIPDMGKCGNYDGPNKLNKDNVLCFPIIYQNDTLRIQDNYNMDLEDKWSLVNDMLNHNSKARTEKEEFTIYDANHEINDKFYNPKYTDLLTINYMNIQSNYLNDTRGSSIPEKAKYMNDNLSDYIDINKNKKFNNIWFIFDFPGNPLIRKIWQNNFINNNDYKTNDINFDVYKVIKEFDYFAVQLIHGIKRNEYNNEVEACLQRKIIINEKGEKQELVKTTYKCVNNKMNKWRLRQNGKYYNIISSYDAKCLTHSNGELYIQECKENNSYQDFTINDGKICSAMEESKCLDNSYKFVSTPLESPRYEHLTCSSIYAELGYDCCSEENNKVEYVDEIGNWGIENGKLCGIGYERCSFGALDEPYPCCSSVNPEVVMTDEKGNSWGYEDGQWCGIGEAKYDTSFRIKNRKTQECLITNLHSDTNVLLMGDCNHSKCLYAMNSQDPRMIECTEPDREINHHIHFKIVDNKYICLKNSVDPEICLNGNTKNNNSLKFETTKNEYSE